MNNPVLCTGHVARSILLDSILHTESAGRLRAWFAGSQPSTRILPQSSKLSAKKGHDTSDFRPKNWDVFVKEDVPEMDLVVSGCGSAAKEACPVWPCAPVRTHWGVKEPAAAAQPDLDAAFRADYDILGRRARALLPLPLEPRTGLSWFRNSNTLES